MSTPVSPNSSSYTNLLKLVRSHEVALAELNNLSSSRWCIGSEASKDGTSFRLKNPLRPEASIFKKIIVDNMAQMVIPHSKDIIFEAIADKVLAEDSPPQLETQGEASVSTAPSLQLVEPVTASLDVTVPVIEQVALVVSTEPEVIAVIVSTEVPLEPVINAAVSEPQGFIPFKPVATHPDKPASSSAQLQTFPTSRGKEVESIPADQSEQVGIALDHIQLDNILSKLFSLQSDLTKLRTDQFLSSESLIRSTETLDGKMKHLATDVSNLTADINSKLRKAAMSQIQSQEFISSQIVASQNVISLRLDSIESKLDMVTAVMFSKSKPEVIVKKGKTMSRQADKPVDRRSTDDANRKHHEPDSSKKDKGPADKRFKS